MLAIHRDQIASFGGAPGVRDEGLLDSALAQPRATSGGALLHRTIYQQAAAYLFHICANHPFADGNKRAAFAAMDTFLRINGIACTLSDDEAYDLTIGVAAGTTSKRQVAATIRGASSKLA